MRRTLLVLSLALVATVGACRYLLPERFAVNAPLAHTLFGGRGAGTPEAEVIDQRMQAPDGFTVGLWATDAHQRAEPDRRNGR